MCIADRSPSGGVHTNKYYQETLQTTDEKYQEITYWKYGKFETVHPLSWTPIDLEKALNETQRLLPEYEESIGFTNGRNKDSIDLWVLGKEKWYKAHERTVPTIHTAEQSLAKWYIQVPVFTRDEWDGYYWWANTDTKRVLDVIRLFFEEVEWFGMLDFKLANKYSRS